jgi:hypothetical protein
LLYLGRDAFAAKRDQGATLLRALDADRSQHPWTRATVQLRGLI